MLRENSEYLTRVTGVWDFHLSHQQEACIARIQVQSLQCVIKPYTPISSSLCNNCHGGRKRERVLEWLLKQKLNVMLITSLSLVNVYLCIFEEHGLRELKINSMLMKGKDRIKPLRPRREVTLPQEHWCWKWGLSWSLILWARSPWNVEEALTSLLSICFIEGIRVMLLPPPW